MDKKTKMKTLTETKTSCEPAVFDLRYFSRSAGDMDGRGVIQAMFDMTDDDGTFMTFEYRADSVSEISKVPTLYTMGWSGDSPADEIALYESFISTIEEISGYVGPDNAIPLEKLPAPLAAFASIYLLPAEAFYTEEQAAAANEDMDSFEDGDQIDEDRLLELRMYAEAVERDAKARVGSGPLAHDLVRRCQRVLMLRSMSAPDFIIASEERKLAYTMAVHFRAELYMQ